MPPTRFFEELASRVRQARKARSFSLQQAAERAGVSRRFLVEVEAARTNPSIGKLAALAEAYGLPLRDLCDLPTTAAPDQRIALLGSLYFLRIVCFQLAHVSKTCLRDCPIDFDRL